MGDDRIVSHHIGAMHSFTLVFIQVVGNVTLFGVGSQPDLITGSVRRDVDPQTVILYNVSDDIQITHHDNQTQ